MDSVAHGQKKRYSLVSRDVLYTTTSVSVSVSPKISTSELIYTSFKKLNFFTHATYYKMSPIYILELESAKYYVGYNSIDAQLKMKNSWTSKYKPLKVVSAIHTNYKLNIDDVVKNVMAKYGISSVRGGSYEDIDSYTYDELSYEIWGDRYNDLTNDLIMNDSELEDSDYNSSYDDGYDSF